MFPKAVIQKCSMFFFSIIVMIHPFTETDDSQSSSKREGTIFIPLCYVHRLTHIQTFICDFSSGMIT